MGYSRGGGGGKTDEEVRDLVASFLAGGSNITVSHDDPGDSLTVAVSPQGTGSGLDADQLDGSEGSSFGGALELVERQTPSGVASVDFTTSIDGTGDVYLLSLSRVIPATDQVEAFLRFSQDGGASWDAGANYDWSEWCNVGGSSDQNGASGDGAIKVATTLGRNIGSAAGEEGLSGVYRIYSPAGTNETLVRGAVMFRTHNAAVGVSQFGGIYGVAGAVDGFRFLFSSGNVESGVISLHRVLNS